MDQSTIHSTKAARAALEAPSDQSLRVPCYCEENVWRLAYRKLQQTDSKAKEYFVVFITNPLKCVPMFHQLAVSDPTKPVYWDYHVILICHQGGDGSSPTVFDMDSHLPFPCPLDRYMNDVFSAEIQWPEEYKPYFRVIEAEVFLASFGSDRSHMLNPLTRQWNATPPSYECIMPSAKANLERYMTINNDDIGTKSTGRTRERSPFGSILSLSEIRKRFSHIDG